MKWRATVMRTNDRCDDQPRLGVGDYLACRIDVARIAWAPRRRPTAPDVCRGWVFQVIGATKRGVRVRINPDLIEHDAPTLIFRENRARQLTFKNGMLDRVITLAR